MPSAPRNHPEAFLMRQVVVRDLPYLLTLVAALAAAVLVLVLK